MARAKRLGSVLLCLLMLLALLAGCTGGGTAGSSSQAAAGGSSGAADTGEQITITMLDFSDGPAVQRELANKKYMEENPHIKIDYTLTTIAQMGNTILTAVKSGQAPDIFPVPENVTAYQAVEEGWFLALDDYVDESEWDRYIPGTFAEGKCMVNGKHYMIPENPYAPSSSIFYNKDLFREAGLDPEKPPSTYSELREYAKKITEAGNGAYYGIVEAATQQGRMVTLLADWGNLNGSSHRASSYPINLETGTPSWAGDKAIENLFALWQGLYDDGSIHPDSGSFNGPQTREAFAQGQAGFLVQGWWNVGLWPESNPELDFGLCPPPIDDTDGNTEYVGSLPLTSASKWCGVNANTEHPEEAVRYLMTVVAGEEYQAAGVEAGVHISFLKGVNEEYAVLPMFKQYIDINDDYGRFVPESEVENPETSMALTKFQDVHPNAYEILSGVMTGQVTDYKTALAEYDAAALTAWETAIAEANADGCDLSIDDFAYPTWNPKENWTEEDYATRK